MAPDHPTRISALEKPKPAGMFDPLAITLEEMGVAFRTLAAAVRSLGTTSSSATIEWLEAATFERAYPFKFRVVLDAGKRGELPLYRAGGEKHGKPVVKRSDVDRWIESKLVKPKLVAADSGDAYADLIATERGER